NQSSARLRRSIARRFDPASGQGATHRLTLIPQHRVARATGLLVTTRAAPLLRTGPNRLAQPTLSGIGLLTLRALEGPIRSAQTPQGRLPSFDALRTLALETTTDLRGRRC